MDGFKESVKLWKHESFRKFMADKKKEYQIQEINADIAKLIERRDSITAENFRYEQGNNTKKLKKLLPWNNIKPFLKEYKVQYPEKKRKAGSIIRFCSELLSGA